MLGSFVIQSNKTTGRFQGKGLHSARTLEKGMEDGVLKAVDINNTSRVFNNFSDIPVDVNGVREAQILKTEGFEKKSFFPREWSDETVLDAIVEASQQSTGNTFSAVVTRNGRSVPIFGVLDNGKIKTAYPIFTP